MASNNKAAQQTANRSNQGPRPSATPDRKTAERRGHEDREFNRAINIGTEIGVQHFRQTLETTTLLVIVLFFFFFLVLIIFFFFFWWAE